MVSAQATLQSAATQVQADSNRVTAQLNQIGNQITAVQTQQQSDTQAAQVKAAQQYLAMQANLQNLQSVQSNYLNAFSSFIDDPFAQASLEPDRLKLPAIIAGRFAESFAQTGLSAPVPARPEQ